MMIRYVDHTYRDFARYIDDGGELTKHKKCDRNFPSKLHAMLSDERHSDAIAWMPHGRAFKIIDKDILMTAVLPEYIVCKKYESFSRQLNAWGFKRLYQSGPDLGCYYHECFLRGQPRLTTLIMRLPPNQGKATPYPAGEPNFYHISVRHPLPDATPSRAPGATAAAASSSHAPARDGHQGPSPSLTRTSTGPSDQSNATGALESGSGLSSSGRSHGHLTQKSEGNSVAIDRLSTLHHPNFPSNMQHAPSFPMTNPPQEHPGSAAGPAAPASVLQGNSHGMARAQEYPRHQPSGHASFSRAPDPSAFYQTGDRAGHYSGNSHGQYPAQAPPPQYQYLAPNQQQYQSPVYPPAQYHGAADGAYFQQPPHPYPASDGNFGHPSGGGIPGAVPATLQPSYVGDTHNLNGGSWQSSSMEQPPVASKPERDAKNLQS